MAAIRVELMPEFKGEDVVLVAVDGDGLDAVRSALVEVGQRGGHPLSVEIAGRRMVFDTRPGEARVDLGTPVPTWTFSRAKIDEIVDKLDAMRASPVPCHNTVDIDSPVETLFLSKDEYL